MKNIASIVRGISAIAISIFALSFTTPAQTPDQVAKLISLPKLQPRPKTERHMFGTKMTVTVAVDAKGKVTAVNAIDGPGWVCPNVDVPDVTILREAAKVVAMKAKFEPAVVGGKKVDSFGVFDIEFPVRAVAMRVEHADAAVESRGTSDTNSSVKTLKVMQGDDSSRADIPSNQSDGDGAGDFTNGGGVLNRKANALPKPTYPSAARAVRASGMVSVLVLIGEDGNILSANPTKGHPLLRNASRIAACGSKFSPTLLSGQPVKVSGYITYNYVP